jgi:hypothetical protein
VRRERILPGEKTLAEEGLYEVRPSRQLCPALHEPDSLQWHRTTGKVVRPLRLGAQGSFDAESLNCKNKPRECAVLSLASCLYSPSYPSWSQWNIRVPAW